jgi:hypothetical protein
MLHAPLFPYNPSLGFVIGDINLLVDQIHHRMIIVSRNLIRLEKPMRPTSSINLGLMLLKTS